MKKEWKNKKANENGKSSLTALSGERKGECGKVNTDDDVVISAANVQVLGEMIAIRALKIVKFHYGHTLDTLYKGMLRDIYLKDKDGCTFTDGYDVVQTAICFLCENMGRMLGEKYSERKDGKSVSVKNACYSEVDRYIRQQYNQYPKFVNIEDMSHLTVPPAAEAATKEEYAKVAMMIEKMNLTEGERAVLDYYMSGMLFSEIADYLAINRATVWRRRQRLQQKFNALTK